jgi:hypothetical protein
MRKNDKSEKVSLLDYPSFWVNCLPGKKVVWLLPPESGSVLPKANRILYQYIVSIFRPPPLFVRVKLLLLKSKARQQVNSPVVPISNGSLSVLSQY